MRVKRAIGYGGLAVVVLLALGITFTIGWRPIVGPKSRPLTDRRFDSTPARLARGQYMVNGLVGCLACHSDSDTSKPGAPPRGGMEGAGHDWSEDGVPGLVAPNLTPDRETGIGAWSDDAIARAVREGIGNDGRALFPIMPYQNFRHMSDEDLASVIVYVRTLAPIRRQLPKTQLAFPLNRFINAVPRPITEPVHQPDLSTPVARGRYLVTLGSCADCHSPMDGRGQPIPGMEFAGGTVFNSPAGPVTSANLTPDPSGIPYYTEDVFLQVMRTGALSGRKINDVMPWAYYGKLTDDDLKAMFAYIRTFTPVVHRVDNSVAPTPCPVCKQTHGRGDENKPS